MSQYWSSFIKSLTPYIPGEQPKILNLVKLNTNENPYPPSPKVIRAIEKELPTLRLYPDPQSTRLVQTIADHFQLPANHVFVGNGSDEVLAHAFQAFFIRDGELLLFPDITYSFYSVYCQLYQIPYKTVPLNDLFEVDVDSYAKHQHVAGVVMATPNAPTSIAMTVDEIEKLLQTFPLRVVLIDEAYVDFGGKSVVSLIAKYPNLLVVQTFSKSRSLAGMRIGFGLGQPHLIEGLIRVKDSFNSYPIDRLAGVAAIAAIEDHEYFETCCDKIIQTREGLTLMLEDLGFEVLRSSSNFLFARHPQFDARKLMQDLRNRSVLVRHFLGERTRQFLRITVGTPEQCETLLTALRAIIQKTI